MPCDCIQTFSNLPLIWQFLVLELAIDGLKLAAINTPNMLSTPLSVMAALVLGEFSVNSGWFSSEVMLYMAFVAIANYTQSNYELGYALKFLRIITLLLAQPSTHGEKKNQKTGFGVACLKFPG